MPAVTLAAPADGSTFNGASNILFAASVTTNGNHTVEKVQFYTNAVLLAESVSAPYQINWNSASSGAYSITAKLLYDGGSVLTPSATNITVTNAAPAIGQFTGTVNFSSGTVTMSFIGTTGHAYNVQRSTNLLSGFTTLGMTNAPAGAAFKFTDRFGDLGGAPGAAFYRLNWTP